MTREQREALDALGSEKRQLFVIYYTGEAKHNGALAARMAGYSEDTAVKIASELLTFPDVMHAVEVFDRPVRDRAIIGKRESQKILSKIVRGELDDVVMTREGPVDVRPAHRTRIDGIKTLADMRGWNASKKLDVSINAPKDEAEALAMLQRHAARLGYALVKIEGEEADDGDE